MGYDLSWMDNRIEPQRTESESRMDTPDLVMIAISALVAFLILLLLLNTQFVNQTPDNTSQRLARSERKLDAIIAHLQIEAELYSPIDSRIEEFVRAGKIIDAVKAYREVNQGASLREAKLAVDDLKARLNAEQLTCLSPPLVDPGSTYKADLT